MGGAIVGWGVALPEKIVTNADLCEYLDTSDQWIRERSGIQSRHVGGTSTGLATEAGLKAIRQAGIDPATVDLLVLATATPDQSVPATSASVQHALGLKCGAFDLNAACSGFIYALVTAHAYLSLGCRRILVIGVDTISRIVDWSDRSTAVLFGDGAGAVVLDAVEGPGQLLGWHLDCDGSGAGLLQADVGGHVKMDGREVFKRAVRLMVESSERSMAMAGITASQVGLLVPHQANIRIIEAASERLSIPMDRISVVLHRTGNTSSASVPLAMVQAIDDGRIHDGDYLLMVGFGAGMTAASTVIRWGRASS
jgi:3-oxoacyl-[acyl-carrier-protein] synthase-3